MKNYYTKNNLCVCCGKEIPEGLYVCPLCEKKNDLKEEIKKAN